MKLLIKLGGSLVDDAASRANLARQIFEAQTAHQTVIVHGGGRQLTRFLDERGIPSRFVNGLRVTTEEALDSVLKVLAGSVNKQLVNSLRAAGVNGVGLTGIDGRLTTAEQLSHELGAVGRVTGVDARLLHLLTGSGYVPVVACVAGDDAGAAWNINADQMAAACAQGFGADHLIFLTDVAGVLDAAGVQIPALDTREADALLKSGVARGGMRAKLEAAIDALHSGVVRITIAAGSGDRNLSRVLAGEPCGTKLRAVSFVERISR